MDEIKFRCSSKWESVQVKLNLLIERNGLEFIKKQRLQITDFIGSGFREFWHFCTENCSLRKQLIADLLRRLRYRFISDSKALFFFIYNYLPKNLTKTNVFFASIGLFFGFSFGLIYGLRTSFINKKDANWKKRIKPQNSNEVTILVTISSLHLIDLLIYESDYGKYFRKMFGYQMPKNKREVNCGRGGCGLVIDYGVNVKSFHIGQNVWFVSPFWNLGTCSTIVVLDETLVSAKPERFSDEFAASLAYSGSRAFGQVKYVISMQFTNRRYLVLGGDSVIGIVIIHLLKKQSKASIVTTCANKHSATFENMGCEEIIRFSMESSLNDQNNLMSRLSTLGQFDAVFVTADFEFLNSELFSYCKFKEFVFNTLPMPIKSDSFNPVQGFFFAKFVSLYNWFQYLYGSESRYEHNFEPNLSSKLLDELEDHFPLGDNFFETIANRTFSSNEILNAFEFTQLRKSLCNVLVKFR